MTAGIADRREPYQPFTREERLYARVTDFVGAASLMLAATPYQNPELMRGIEIQGRPMIEAWSRMVLGMEEGEQRIVDAIFRHTYRRAIETLFEPHTGRGLLYEVLVRCDGSNHSPYMVQTGQVCAEVFIQPRRGPVHYRWCWSPSYSALTFGM